ncbi:TetR-like C-terminal domain-containing protein, partial [Actinomadura rubrisoli]
PSTGSVRDDLLVTLTCLRDTLVACRGAAFKVLKEESADGKGLLHEVIRQRISQPVRDMMYEALRQGAERGEVRPEAVTRQTADVGPALIVYYNITEGTVYGDESLASVVDEVLVPIIRP